MSLAGAAIVAAESILALTPIAIKQTPLDPVSAVWSRILSSSILGYALTGDRQLITGEMGIVTALGYTNLLHIASSYEAFRNLPAGQAMSLLYTYPLWNLLSVSFFNHEPISRREFWLMGLATIGSVLLNMDPGIAAPAASASGKAVRPGWGLLMGLIMALTESGMHTMLKHVGWRDPAKSVWLVSTSSAAWLGGILFAEEFIRGRRHDPLVETGSWLDAVMLTIFHSVTLFSGYWLRFFAVPRLSTVTYSILSYTGLLASYIFGLLFLKETPGWMSLIGAAIIVASGLALQQGHQEK